MTADLEQVRRDAQRMRQSRGRTDAVVRLADHCLALLAELEQAEQDRQRVEAHHDNIAALLVQADARLASVPALVEALRRIAEGYNDDDQELAADALTVYEQSHGGNDG